MQFMMMLNESPEEFAKRESAEAPAYWGAWNAFIGAMNAAGIVVKGDGLLGPSMATTLRLRDNKRQVQDGPFADTKEALGGYFILEVPTLEAALDWASKAPCVHTGSVEIRPVLSMAPPS